LAGQASGFPWLATAGVVYDVGMAQNPRLDKALDWARHKHCVEICLDCRAISPKHCHCPNPHPIRSMWIPNGTAYVWSEASGQATDQPDTKPGLSFSKAIANDLRRVAGRVGEGRRDVNQLAESRAIQAPEK
jgi:hypothetical protein